MQTRTQSSLANLNLSKGISLSLIGYFSMALMSICAKFLTHLPLSTLIFAQFFIGFFMSLPKVVHQGRAGLKMSKPGLMLLRALTGMLSLAAMFFAIRHIPLVDAVLLQNTVPLFVPLIMLVVLRKSIRPIIIPGLIMGFLGVIFIIKPNANIINPAALIGLSAGLLSAISVVVTAVLRRTESANSITFYFLLIASLITAPFMLWNWSPIQAHDLIFLLGLGVCLYFGQLLVTQAFLYGEAHILAPLSFTTVIFTGLLGWLIWAHIPDGWSFLGIALICLGGMLVVVMADKK